MLEARKIVTFPRLLVTSKDDLPGLVVLSTLRVQSGSFQMHSQGGTMEHSFTRIYDQMYK